MDFDTFKSVWLGRRVDFDHVFKFQCVDLILQYLYECYGIAFGVSGNAIDYWVKTGVNGFNQVLLNKFTKVPTTEAIKGDIVVLNGLPGNPFGHIGVATGNINAGEIEILEQNGQNGDGDGGNPDTNDDNVPLTDGNQIRVRWINRSRVAGLLRPNESSNSPAPEVHPYTIENIAPKQVQLNKDTHKWGLHYDNFTAINNNPEGDIAAGAVVTVSAILHHNIGYNYYLENPEVASGYNVLDCDDFTPPPPPPVKTTPPAGALRAPSTETYEVVVDVPGYLSSNQAINHINPKVTVPIGTYFIFNTREPALNVTKTPGQPGAWINPADNTVNPPATEPDPEPEPEEVAPPEPASVPDFAEADTYREYPKPELFVAMRPVEVVDLQGVRKTANMPQYSITYITGSFNVGGVEYARPKSATDKNWWYGIAWIDPKTNLANLELEAEVFNSKTTLADRRATRTLKKSDYLLLAVERIRNLYLGFTHLLSKMKSSK